MTSIEQVQERIKEASELGVSLLSRGASSIRSTVNRRVAVLKEKIEELKKTNDDNTTTNQ